MNLKIKSIFFLLLLSCSFLHAQEEVTVKGTVTSAGDGEPILGANIVVLGTVRGTSTDFDGKYSIKVKSGEIIQFSYLGFVTKTITFTDQRIIDAQLVEDSNQLDEIIIVGYGDQKKKTVTSALSQVSGDDLQKQSVARVEDALRGRVAGLRI